MICALCSTALSESIIEDQSNLFCCVGCYTVFQILAVQKVEENFRSHPLFIKAVETGLISNPQLRKECSDVAEEEKKRIVLEIEEMWCSSCAELIRLVLIQKKGISHCSIDYTTDLGCIVFNPRYLSEEQVFGFINSLGYRARSLEQENTELNKSLILRFAVAAFCSLNLMMFAYPIYSSHFNGEFSAYIPILSWLSLVITLPVLLYCSLPILQRFYYSMIMGIFGMESLAVLGVGSSLFISLFEMYRGTYHIYFDSMAVIVTFILLGKMMESKAKFSAKSSILQLTKSLPKRGRKKNDDGSNSFVFLKDIKVGDCLLVLTGEKIVLDGVIIEGKGTCNDAIVTGESFPIFKKEGDRVISGSILQSGFLVFKVTQTQKDCSLAKIIEWVDERVSHKHIYNPIVEKIVRAFIPCVIGIAIVVTLFNFAFHGEWIAATLKGISVVLIACPCAIGIAAPMAESRMINALAALGIFVRNRGCLSLLSKATCYVFDKTGTITEGKFQLFSGDETLTEQEKKDIRSICQFSTHPLSIAIKDHLQTEFSTTIIVEEIIGKGLKGDVEGRKYLIGSLNFLKENHIDVPDKSSGEIITPIYVCKDNTYLTTLMLGDRLRPQIKDLITCLKPAKTFLLSGDQSDVVKVVSQYVGFDSWKGECSPLEKRNFIEALKAKGEQVVFIGDGINDAAALAAAPIGISVLSASDMSIQVSDIFLTTDKLNVLLQMRMIAKRGNRILKQNLFWAFFYNIIGIGLAAVGLLTPLFATFAMTVSSLLVLFNSKRIKETFCKN